MATKRTSKTRCWPGYEPVPGKAPHEAGSCRKKAPSKSTAADKRAQARRKKQLDGWQKKHPGTKRSAAQHLSAPGTRAKSRTKRSTTPKKRTTSGTRRRTATKRGSAA